MIQQALADLLARPETETIARWLYELSLRSVTIKIEPDSITISATSGGPPFVHSVYQQIALATLKKERAE